MLRGFICVLIFGAMLQYLILPPFSTFLTDKQILMASVLGSIFLSFIAEIIWQLNEINERLKK